MEYVILPMLPHHWDVVRQIYGEGIATRNATFETELPDWGRWDNAHRKECRLVAADAKEASGSDILGWAALSPISARRVYSGVAEVSVYVSGRARGRGVGKALLEALVRESESNGVWTLQAGIFPENSASVALHKSCGFHQVGVRRQIGKLENAWRDVLLLERRSKKVGL